MLFDKSLIKYKKKINFIHVNYNDTILTINVLSVRIPFGIKDYFYNDKIRYHLQISIDKDNLKLNNLLNFIINLEESAKDYTLKDETLFKNKKFISKIYYGKNDPLIRLDFKEDTIFKNNLNEYLFLNDYLNKKISAYLDFSYNGIYIGNNNYGLSFKINEIIIQKDQPTTTNETIFTF